MAKSKIFGEISVIWIEIPLKGFSARKFMLPQIHFFPEEKARWCWGGNCGKWRSWEEYYPGFKVQLFSLLAEFFIISHFLRNTDTRWCYGGNYSWEEYYQGFKFQLFHFHFLRFWIRIRVLEEYYKGFKMQLFHFHFLRFWNKGRGPAKHSWEEYYKGFKIRLFYFHFLRF